MKGIAFSIGLLSVSLVTSQGSFAQTIDHPGSDGTYIVPFASSDNVVELTVENGTGRSLEGLTAEVGNTPAWAAALPDRQTVPAVEPGKCRIVRFRFSVSLSAPVGRPDTLEFILKEPRGARWTKAIRVSVGAPDHVELFQNFPNPFNPVSRISFQLSVPSRATVTIFNTLGQEVETLVDDDLPAGYHERSWKADRLSGGVYYCQMVAVGGNGERIVQRRRMLFLK